MYGREEVLGEEIFEDVSHSKYLRGMDRIEGKRSLTEG